MPITKITNMPITKITIGRLFNLGSYEHVRYELTAEVHDHEKAQDIIIALERILEALKPERSSCVSSRGEIERENHRIAGMKLELNKDGEDAFRRNHGHFVGTCIEYIARCESSAIESLGKRIAYEQRAKKARELLDNLGGAAEWKDAKLGWEDYSFGDD